ncbi:outer membrane protein assembly factor BamD [Gymnodinialimonas ceratoperidinii]|uniref:Outer membrane protein assembly factor BamD n=1 Tax=Gymnodinialimonas ceratoperidinii TaxID=2856823 RepID=A0A8F6YCI3_9RHOB|nr:outer membrane protein assembly factor BamD [Gymnodinialimonas ceratoperidinii]QXT41271.1 outer membrane protein assembly factor BamD [Gymnodinialimonas ceratoperidinii]
MTTNRFRLSGAALGLTLVLAGCGGGGLGGGNGFLGTGLFSGGGGGFFAGRNANLPLEELDAETIYQQAEFQLENGRADNAAELFIEVERLHPYSTWAERALIMAAFAYHEDGDYEAARVAAQRYLDFYPGNEDAAYAQYLLALSYYDQIDQVGRDQGVTYQALQALRTVIERYPDSEYTQDAILRFDLAYDHLAGKEMEVGRYYLRREHYTSAINRFRVVVEEFQTTTHTPEALLRLVEAYLALGLTDEAQTAGAILGYNFQSSPFYDDAYRQLTGQGLSLEAAGENWLREVWQQTVRGDWL